MVLAVAQEIMFIEAVYGGCCAQLLGGSALARQTDLAGMLAGMQADSDCLRTQFMGKIPLLSMMLVRGTAGLEQEQCTRDSETWRHVSASKGKQGHAALSIYFTHIFCMLFVPFEQQETTMSLEWQRPAPAASLPSTGCFGPHCAAGAMLLQLLLVVVHVQYRQFVQGTSIGLSCRCYQSAVLLLIQTLWIQMHSNNSSSLAQAFSSLVPAHEQAIFQALWVSHSCLRCCCASTLAAAGGLSQSKHTDLYTSWYQQPFKGRMEPTGT